MPEPAQQSQRRTARVVTYGLVGILAVSAVAQLELWPLSSMRLFSELRSGQRQALVLTAVGHHGERSPVPLNRTVRQTRAAQQQLPDLPDLGPTVRRRAIVAWLTTAGLDPDRYDAVILERVTYRLDPAGGPNTALRRQELLVVPL